MEMASLKAVLGKHLVSAQRLVDSAAVFQVIDASWHLPNSDRNAREEFRAARIKDAVFFDIDECVLPDTTLPHMMPPQSLLTKYLCQIGIDTRKPAVVYDSSDFGIFSSARVWYMLQSIGVQAAVLDGGMKKWKDLGYEINTREPATPKVLDQQSFQDGGGVNDAVPVKERLEAFCDASQVLDVVQGSTSNVQIIDARPAGRFSGEMEEPRTGLNKGHIPGSANVPFLSVLANDGTLLPSQDLERVFKEQKVGLDSEKFMFSCGSGITACVPLLAMVHGLQIPLERCSVYDGAFAEWGIPSNNFPTACNDS